MKYAIPKEVDLKDVMEQVEFLEDQLQITSEVKLEDWNSETEVARYSCKATRNGVTRWAHVERSRVYQGEVDSQFYLRTIIAVKRNAYRKLCDKTLLEKLIGRF